LNTNDPVWVPTVFTHNRDRLLEGEIVTKLFGQVLAQAEGKGLISDEHFSVDGTMIEAWASRKSFRPKGAPPCGLGVQRRGGLPRREALQRHP
jgi:transposase